jgi:hypothetical protein
MEIVAKSNKSKTWLVNCHTVAPTSGFLGRCVNVHVQRHDFQQFQDFHCCQQRTSLISSLSILPDLIFQKCGLTSRLIIEFMEFEFRTCEF